MARNTPRRRKTGRPSGTATMAGASAEAASTAMKREAGDHGGGYAAHAAQDDDREPFQFHAAPHVGRDGVEGEPEEHAGRAAQRAGEEEGHGDGAVDVDAEDAGGARALRDGADPPAQPSAREQK